MPIKNYSQTISSLIERLRSRLPEADVTQGSVIRELLDAVAAESSLIYGSVKNSQKLQSIRTVSGQNLDRLAANYSKQRKNAQLASGVVLLTKATLSPGEEILVRAGTIVSTVTSSLTQGNKIRFQTVGDVVIKGANSAIYRSTANQYRSLLDSYAISDEFAVPVPVMATVRGIAGNVAKGSIRDHSISGIHNVINVQRTSGGEDTESDNEFRKRLLLVFAGSNIATDFGLKSLLLDEDFVSDVLIVGPGDALMTRDGTLVSGGTIISPGSGGMIDVYVAGEVLSQGIESYIFADKGPDGFVAVADNDYVLGRATYVDPITKEPKILEFKNRKLLLTDDTLELGQPIDSVVSVIGSQSGPFVENVNYILLKDIDDEEPTAYANSGFGNDKIRWTNNSINIVDENVTRSRFNAYDLTRRAGVISIEDIRYSIAINGESVVVTEETDIVSTVVENTTYDPTPVVKLLLKHGPVFNVRTVENILTGETYKIERADPDGALYISGRSLPTPADVVIAEYEWKKCFDPTFDYSLSENLIRWTLPNNHDIIDLARNKLRTGDNNPVIFSDTVNDCELNQLSVPSELVVTAAPRGSENSSVYVNGTTITTVLNQYQRLPLDAQIDSSGEYVIVNIDPPADPISGGPIGDVYSKDILSSFEPLARLGQTIGRVYLSDNHLNLSGDLTKVGQSYIVYNNDTLSEIKLVPYTTTANHAEIYIPLSEISSLPKAGDELYISFIWEVPNPISLGSGTVRETVIDNDTGLSVSKIFYVLGDAKSDNKNILSNVNNPLYANPNSGYANVGNYDRLFYPSGSSAGSSPRYTKKRFAKIDRITVASEDTNAQVAADIFNSVVIQSLSAPNSGLPYSVSYTYTAPKDGERITVNYLHNKLISDLTRDIEEKRIINTNILVKAGVEVPLAVSLAVTTTSDANVETVSSNVITALLTILNTQSLSGTLTLSFVTSELFRLVPDLVNVNFINFSKRGESGIKSIDLARNEFYSLNEADIAVRVALGADALNLEFTEGSTSPSFSFTGAQPTCEAQKKTTTNVSAECIGR